MNAVTLTSNGCDTPPRLDDETRRDSTPLASSNELPVGKLWQAPQPPPRTWDGPRSKAQYTPRNMGIIWDSIGSLREDNYVGTYITNNIGRYPYYYGEVG